MAVELNYLYVCMLKGMLSDKNYAITVTSVFEPDYFEDPGMVDIFNYTKEHVEKYNTLPDRDIIINSVDEDKKDGVVQLFAESDATDFSVSSNYDWLRKETNKYLKDRAMKQSIIQSVDIIDRGGDPEEIKKLVEAALCKDIDIDLGLNYFDDLAERLKRVLTASDNRVRTFYPTLDEMFNGGYPPYTLNMMIAKVHGHKCVSENTPIVIRHDLSGIVEKIKIGDFYKYSYGDEYIGGLNMPSLESFQNKHGEVEGQQRYDSWIEKLRNKKPSPSTKGISKLVLFQNKYGEVEGQQRYDSWMEKNRENGRKGTGRGTLQWYQNKYGKVEGQQRYDDKGKKISDKGRGTLQWYQNKYGEVEGQQRYDEYISKQRFSQSKIGYQDKHGEVEGCRLWNERCLDIKKRGTLSGFQNKYGEVEGQQRYDERQEKWQDTMQSKPIDEIEDIIRRRISNGRYNGFSKISQELFWILYDETNRIFSDIRFATLKDGVPDYSGFNNEKFISHPNRNMFTDFCIGDIMKVIEFDGDYWHGESRGNKKLDEYRDDTLELCGYEVLHIKERDYKNDCDCTIKLCMDFIYG